MSRYIDADALLSNLPNDLPYKASVKRVLIQAPSADVVEVVRCKDCKHYGGVTYGYVCSKYSGAETKVCTEKDHYCSYGERRENVH